MHKKILIFGSGSIGTHMAFAARKLKFHVDVTDISSNSLKRMKKQIFPKRYGKWDNKINLVNYENIFLTNKKYDLVIIGTPPKTHLNLYNKICKKINFDKILIEKPLCVHNQRYNINYKKFTFCGYNHSVSKSFDYFLKNINKKNINFIDVSWREGFSGILNAHFWMKNEFDSYLGNLDEGGGSLHEHSHGLHLSLILMEYLKKQKNIRKNFFQVINKIKQKNYDKVTQIFFKTKNFVLNYTTDLITEPANKSILISGKNFKARWICGFKKDFDLVEINNNSKIRKKLFKKSRSSEFENELKHIFSTNTLKKYNNSYLSIKYAKEVMQIIKKITNEKF